MTIVVILAIGLPRITSDGLNSLGSAEEKKEMEKLEEKILQASFRPLDKLMVQSYEVKPNRHQQDNLKQGSNINYCIT